MELTKNTSSDSHLFDKLEKKKHCKVTYLNWKVNRKEHTVEALHNLSSNNVYLLFVSLCRFHETFNLNQGVSMPHLLPFLYLTLFKEKGKINTPR